MATATKEVKSEETVAKKVTPKAEKKVAAPKVEKKVTAVKKVEETATTVTDSVKDTATKIADAAKSSVDTIKDSFTDAETAIKDARVSGNERAKKIFTSVFSDKANDTVVDFVGYFGEATAVCSTIMCSPMAVPANKINTLYKKITA